MIPAPSLLMTQLVIAHTRLRQILISKGLLSQHSLELAASYLYLVTQRITLVPRSCEELAATLYL